MRRKISSETWSQVDIAIAAGIGLREIARNMDIPAGTVLAHAKHKELRRQIDSAKSAAQSQQSNAITPMRSAAITMRQRGDRYADRLGGGVERVVPHLESLDPSEVLKTARNIDKSIASPDALTVSMSPSKAVVHLEPAALLF